jgi:hypothetical protein
MSQGFNMSDNTTSNNQETPAPAANFVLDKNLRQVLPGDYVLLPCFNSLVDRGMVLSINGSCLEIMILSPDTGIPETVVLDMRRPDPATGLFGRYGYLSIQVAARKGDPPACDFVKQLLSACEEMARQVPKFNPYMMAQANARLEYLNRVLN